jgi:uncharacterized protein (DUF302 family)
MKGSGTEYRRRAREGEAISDRLEKQMRDSMKSMRVGLGIPRSLLIVLLLLSCGVVLAQNQKHRAVQITHVTVEVDAPYDRFTGALENILGRHTNDVEQDMRSNPRRAEERIKAMEGEQGLMIFAILDHGAALNIVGMQAKAKQYLIGNPLTAIQMTRHDLRAALYAPLRVLVYEKDGKTVVEYDQPSSLFGQFDNPEVTPVGVSLDTKLERVIARAAELSR